MKKGKVLLCVLLAFVLCVTPTLAVNASEVTTGTSSVVQVVDADTSTAVDTMSTHLITVGDDKDFGTYKGYYISVPATATNQIGAYQAVVPINISTKGLLVCAINFDTQTHPTATGSFDIYTDEACTNKVLSSEYEDYYTYALKKAGTYYVKFQVSDSTSDGVTPYVFGFASQLGNAADRTLTNKKWIYSDIIDTNQAIYYKVKATKAGSLTFDYKSEYSADVTLCNSSKKAISDEVYVSSSTAKAVFAVKKGTYYFKVDPASDYIYVKSTFKAITDKAGTSKAKAKTIKYGGSTVSATALASDKKGKSDWFKFYNSKSRKVNVTFKGNVSSGKIELEFFDSKGESFGTTYINTVDCDASFSPYTYSYYSSSKKLPKGTYYIKVTKTSTKTSGSYSLKVK